MMYCEIRPLVESKSSIDYLFIYVFLSVFIYLDKSSQRRLKSLEF